jgi:lipoprotein NlpD
MVALRKLILLSLICSLIACSTTPAPVVDRLPAGKQNVSKAQSKPSSDWRPDTYIVKKGDNLFRIGLEYGYDYKEIAQANNIEPPYNINIGQTLRFSALNNQSTDEVNKPSQENNDGVVTYAINSEPSTTPISTTETMPMPALVLSEPKAIREPYSDNALKQPPPIAKPATEKPVAIAIKPSAEIKPEVKPTPEPDVKANNKATGNSSWIWPTKGKLIANFNEAGNKGIDIAGTMGQSIHATAAGKVIYSGSDLRGYGKLVIVKHNATYLSVYAHNSQILVKEGQQVSQGQKIAEMGNTDSNAVKLHFEIRQQGKSVDPNKYLAEN